MLQGWWAAIDMLVDEEGNVSLYCKERRGDEVSVAGATLTGVPMHIVHRDDGYNWETYVNGRLIVSGALYRNPENQEAIEEQFGFE